MTIKIDIDKYTANSPLINKMLHMADSGKFGEKENNNGMVDTEKEANRFLKLAEKNKNLLAKQGYKVEGNSGIFTITRTNAKYDEKNYNSVLTIDREHDFIEERANADGITAKTVFNNNNDINTVIQDTHSEEVFATPDKNGVLHSMSLALLNVLTVGGITRRLNAINQLSNVSYKTN